MEGAVYRDGNSTSGPGYTTAGFVIRMSAYKTVNKRADPKRNFGASLGCNSGAVEVVVVVMVMVVAAGRGDERGSETKREAGNGKEESIGWTYGC